MDRSSSDASLRIGGLAGVVFAVGMVVLGFAVYFTQPAFTEPITEIRDYFTDNATGLQIADWLSALFFVGGFLLFASALRTALRDSDSGGTWSRASFAAAAVSVAVAGSGVFLSTFTVAGMDDLSDDVVHAFMRADAIVYGAILPWGFALFLVGASMVMLRGGRFPRWFAWLGFAAAGLSAVGALWPVDGDPEGALAMVGVVGFIAMLLWVVFTGVTMVRSRA